MPKKWILLRGLAREQRHWGNFRPLLQHCMPEHEFHYLDLPGCGENADQASPTSIQAIRKQLQEYCVAQAISPPFGILGLSLGGMVALDWFSAANEDVKAVVIINTSANDYPLFWRVRPQALGLCLRALFSPIALREQLILKMVSNKYYSDQAIYKDWLVIQQQQPVSRMVIVKQLIAAARFSIPPLRSANKGLVLSSVSDGMVSTQCSRGLSDQFNWPICSHPTAGHDLPLDDPEWVVEKFKEWLSNTERY